MSSRDEPDPTGPLTVACTGTIVGCASAVAVRSANFAASDSMYTAFHPCDSTRVKVLLRNMPSHAPNSTHHGLAPSAGPSRRQISWMTPSSPDCECTFER